MELDPVTAREKKQITARIHPKLYARLCLYVAHTDADLSVSQYLEGLVETEIDRIAEANPRIGELFTLSESIKQPDTPE